MRKASKSPKEGALRKREYDARQRAMGRKPFQIWTTDAEARLIREYLAEIRKK